MPRREEPASAQDREAGADRGHLLEQAALPAHGHLVGRRRRLLTYLRNTDINRYRTLIERLGLRR